MSRVWEFRFLGKNKQKQYKKEDIQFVMNQISSKNNCFFNRKSEFRFSIKKCIFYDVRFEARV